MTIKEIIEMSLFDDYEQVVILYGDVDNPNRPYTGYLSEIPIEFHSLKVEQIASMGELRRTKWNLNKYGWLEIWLEE